MYAVSAESPRGSADLIPSSAGSEPAASTAAAGSPAPANGKAARADFGPNQWLVDELYQRYQADPGSVDRAWWSFFADYHPKPPEQPRPAGAARTASAGQAPTAPAG